MRSAYHGNVLSAWSVLITTLPITMSTAPSAKLALTLSMMSQVEGCADQLSTRKMIWKGSLMTILAQKTGGLSCRPSQAMTPQSALQSLPLQTAWDIPYCYRVRSNLGAGQRWRHHTMIMKALAEDGLSSDASNMAKSPL